jgi:ribosomal protein S18 acetylase RimI-like enzyme
MIATPTLTYRTIDPDADAALAVAHQLDACVETYGDDARFQGRGRYLRWLRDKVEEFPDGFVLAYQGEQCVGQLELQVPYGLEAGYVNLYYVTPPFRGLGYGRRMHAEYAERYFTSWEARRIELHVSPTNERAVRFYLRMNYRFAMSSDRGRPLRLMSKDL